VLIDFLRGKEGAKDALAAVSGEGLPCCSVITVAEVRAGMRPDEKPATMELLDSMELLPVDRETALLAGRLKQESSHRVELDDCLIAATALRHKAGLLTHNPKHYRHAGLEVEAASY
jgi:predicted nucleic acid-binding protein